MKTTTRITCLLAILLIFVAGCSDDPSSPAAIAPTHERVELDPGRVDFSLTLESVSTPDSLVRGPFFLRGSDLRYDDVNSALVVDLTLTNNSQATFDMPVTITFVGLVPEYATILNSPDDRPTFTFEFANDDLWWTPGEESLPLTVMFGVAPGVSVGFVPFIEVGGIQESGLIGGRVWNDLNRNGVIDRGEPGLPDVPVALDDGGPQEILHLARTDRDGRFAFRGLEPGTYEVRVHIPPPGMSSTTSASLHVLLAPDGDAAGSFSAADFGFHANDLSPPGPKLVVWGSELDRLVAFRGETEAELGMPPGVPIHFHWEGFADRGMEIAAYRWGWDVIDPDDPDDPGWSVEPGLGPDHREAAWAGSLEPGREHRLVVHCRDDERHLTRVIVRFRIDGPD